MLSSDEVGCQEREKARLEFASFLKNLPKAEHNYTEDEIFEIVESIDSSDEQELLRMFDELKEIYKDTPELEEGEIFKILEDNDLM